MVWTRQQEDAAQHCGGSVGLSANSANVNNIPLGPSFRRGVEVDAPDFLNGPPRFLPQSASGAGNRIPYPQQTTDDYSFSSPTRKGSAAAYQQPYGLGMGNGNSPRSHYYHTMNPKKLGSSLLSSSPSPSPLSPVNSPGRRQNNLNTNLPFRGTTYGGDGYTSWNHPPVQQNCDNSFSHPHSHDQNGVSRHRQPQKPPRPLYNEYNGFTQRDIYMATRHNNDSDGGHVELINGGEVPLSSLYYNNARNLLNGSPPPPPSSATSNHQQQQRVFEGGGGFIVPNGSGFDQQHRHNLSLGTAGITLHGHPFNHQGSSAAVNSSAGSLTVLNYQQQLLHRKRTPSSSSYNNNNNRTTTSISSCSNLSHVQQGGGSNGSGGGYFTPPSSSSLLQHHPQLPPRPTDINHPSYQCEAYNDNNNNRIWMRSSVGPQQQHPRTLPLNNKNVNSSATLVIQTADASANDSICRIMGNLSTFTRCAETIFGNLHAVASGLYNRSINLQARIDKASVSLTLLERTTALTPCADNTRTNIESSSYALNDAHGTLTTHPPNLLYRDDLNRDIPFNGIDQQVVRKDSMPALMKVLYSSADVPPPLGKLNKYREDGKDAAKFYTDPDYFFELWRHAMSVNNNNNNNSGENVGQNKNFPPTHRDEGPPSELLIGNSSPSVLLSRGGQVIPGSRDFGDRDYKFEEDCYQPTRPRNLEVYGPSGINSSSVSNVFTPHEIYGVAEAATYKRPIADYNTAAFVAPNLNLIPFMIDDTTITTRQQLPLRPPIVDAPKYFDDESDPNSPLTQLNKLIDGLEAQQKSLEEDRKKTSSYLDVNSYPPPIPPPVLLTTGGLPPAPYFTSGSGSSPNHSVLPPLPTLSHEGDNFHGGVNYNNNNYNLQDKCAATYDGNQFLASSAATNDSRTTYHNNAFLMSHPQHGGGNYYDSKCSDDDILSNPRNHNPGNNFYNHEFLPPLTTAIKATTADHFEYRYESSGGPGRDPPPPPPPPPTHFFTAASDETSPVHHLYDGQKRGGRPESPPSFTTSNRPNQPPPPLPTPTPPPPPPPPPPPSQQQNPIKTGVIEGPPPLCLVEGTVVNDELNNCCLRYVDSGESCSAASSTTNSASNKPRNQLETQQMFITPSTETTNALLLVTSTTAVAATPSSLTSALTIQPTKSSHLFPPVPTRSTDAASSCIHEDLLTAIRSGVQLKKASSAKSNFAISSTSTIISSSISSATMPVLLPSSAVAFHSKFLPVGGINGNGTVTAFVTVTNSVSANIPSFPTDVASILARRIAVEYTDTEDTDGGCAGEGDNSSSNDDRDEFDSSPKPINYSHNNNNSCNNNNNNKINNKFFHNNYTHQDRKTSNNTQTASSKSGEMDSLTEWN